MSNKTQLQENNATLEYVIEKMKEMPTTEDCMALIEDLQSDKIDKTQGMGLAGFGTTSDSDKSWETVFTIDSKTGVPTIKKIPSYMSDMADDIGYARVQTGSYKGGGSSNTIPLEFPAKFIVITSASLTAFGFVVPAAGVCIYMTGTSGVAKGTSSASGNSVTFSNTGLNSANNFDFTAIG